MSQLFWSGFKLTQKGAQNDGFHVMFEEDIQGG